MIEMKKVRSSMIDSIGYEESRNVLHVKFNDGALYRYFGVPAAVYTQLMSAQSIGRCFDAEVKKRGYRFEED